MDKQRKITIINEIHYWRENRLLPSHYCDFLLALYTEGSHSEGDELGTVDITRITSPVLGYEAESEQETSSTQRHSMFWDRISFTLLFYVLANTIIIPAILILPYLLNVSIAPEWYVVTAVITTLILFFVGRNKADLLLAYRLTILLVNLFMVSLFIIDQWLVPYYLSIVIIFAQLTIWFYLAVRKKLRLLLVLSIIALSISVFAMIL
ncbi:hypothetical protein SAMN04488134_101355 [Amphibacillus marinus]|uniref:Uncharacterized protein n=1 Tax=Amphibacillus marinus TaxID=872970 RepID=A0A1H8HI20_9BACI|nr:hypothetical protein [Amphibacillus marinus]SEN55813.1 hypothetical protein SAMN04488134_101355 [Amphibacillus marinus]